MLVQTKLFAPPPTTPEAEMNQKMMKYMMIFMAFMFYKVPSGLGLYFITSSLWQIGERLLLPKMIAKATPSRPPRTTTASDKGRGPGGGGNGPGRPTATATATAPRAGSASGWRSSSRRPPRTRPSATTTATARRDRAGSRPDRSAQAPARQAALSRSRATMPT